MVDKQLEDAAYEAMRVLKGMMDDRYQKPAYALQAALYKAKQETFPLPAADYGTRPVNPHPLDTITAVRTFMLTAGQEVKPSPGQPTPEVLKLRLALELEELYEKAQAFGMEGAFQYMMFDRLNQMGCIQAGESEGGHSNYSFLGDGDTLKYDPVALLDACCDQRYVQDGTVLACGLQEAFPAAFANVQASNMSKFCTSIAESNATVKHYADQGVYTSVIVPSNTYTVIKRLSDGKVLKSINYVPASLGPILEKYKGAVGS